MSEDGPAKLLDTREDDDDRDFWFSGVEGIVHNNDDPERRGRVQCVIPSIDENVVYPIWARKMGLFTGGRGYGDFHYVAVGAEVVLFGRLGDTKNLFYAPLYNEDYPVPTDFENQTTRGFREDGDYKVVVEGDFIVRAGRIILQADTSVRIIGPAGNVLDAIERES